MESSDNSKKQIGKNAFHESEGTTGYTELITNDTAHES